jgi:hypothetical protein
VPFDDPFERPRLPLPRALEWIVEWHRGHAGGADMRAQCLAQIETFTALERGILH